MFWEKFAAVCAEKGVNPNDAAKRTHASPEMIAAWRGGDNPSLEKIDRLARLLGVETADLLGDDTDRFEGEGEFWNGLVRACRSKNTDPYILASKLSLSPDAVELWRCGSAPGSLLLAKIASALDVRAADLFYYGDNAGAGDVHELVALRHELETVAENLTAENVRKVIEYAEFVYSKQTYEGPAKEDPR